MAWQHHSEQGIKYKMNDGRLEFLHYTIRWSVPINYNEPKESDTNYSLLIHHGIVGKYNKCKHLIYPAKEAAEQHINTLLTDYPIENIERDVYEIDMRFSNPDTAFGQPYSRQSFLHTFLECDANAMGQGVNCVFKGNTNATPNYFRNILQVQVRDIVPYIRQIKRKFDKQPASSDLRYYKSIRAKKIGF